MKNNCPICSQNKSQRICHRKNNAQICYFCCIDMRNETCDGCKYYKDPAIAAKQKEELEEKQKVLKNMAQHIFQKNKARKHANPKHFTIRIDPEIDEQVDEALQLSERGKYYQAEQMLLKLLKNNYDLESVHYGLGTNYALQNKNEPALFHLNKAVEIFPYNVEAWFNKAMIHKDKMEIPELIKSFRKVVEYGESKDKIVMDAKSILNDLANNLRGEDNISLDDFIVLGEKYNEAFKYMDQKNWIKALGLFNEVLKINSKHNQSYGNIGLCYAFMGNNKKAIEALDKSIELDPKYEIAINNKKIVEALSDGEKLNSQRYASMDYYKDLNERKNSH